MEHMSKAEKRVTGAVRVTELYLSILSLVVSIAMLCASAYAFFVDVSTVSSNEINSASFRVSVSADGAEATEVGLFPNDSFAFVCPEKESGQYELRFTSTGTATQGYCRIVIDGDDANPIFTEQILNNGGTVTLIITAKPGATVSVFPQWGVRN